ncbi:hypothetical protein Pyrde_0358 [Pyrodictium delaneyi]|uniref:DUF1102 domain-containing protein n=1 Tax=Pyrodictium delaneyi TaxID=1273541 RepID=A0A0P0N0M8_9CREN|nr:hypothetical protein [Pyrodictium delaneyi]ALL00408.1 hypothetical protein Pyrde_0358 [Pyrodictium delaneyi]OWJ53887.1 hypothetical protein Pdsh_08315 [Pyrodictium delaneyi]
MVSKRRLLLLASLAIVAVAAAGVSASVFVFYPGDVTAQYTEPPVKVFPGSNAGQRDLNGARINVAIGANQTSVSLALHPTYQITYYKNITFVKNLDTTNSYYVWFKTSQPTNFTVTNAYLKLIINDTSTGDIYVLDLTNSGDIVGPITLNAGANLTIDVQSYYPEGEALPAGVITAGFEIIIGTVNEQPPAPQ